MSDADTGAAMDLALDMTLDGRAMIEASAGTGKTYAIAGLFARLVIERGLGVREILVMTFTRAATGELRQRLHRRMAACDRVARRIRDLAGDPDGTDLEGEEAWAWTLLQRVLGTGQENAADLAERISLAARSLDEARVVSIHSFCQKIVAEYAPYFPGAVQVAELTPDDGELLLDFASDWFLRASSRHPEHFAALSDWKKTPEALARMLQKLAGFGGSIEPAAPETDQLPPAVDLDAAWHELVAIWQRHGEAALADFAKWHGSGFLNKQNFRNGSVERLQRLKDTIVCGQHPEEKEIAFFTLQRLRHAWRGDDPDKLEVPALLAVDGYLAEVAAANERHALLKLQALHRLLAEVRPWLVQRKAELARCSHDDQIRVVAEALRAPDSGSRLAATLRRRFPHALVDEFQDTDPLQFEVLDTIYGKQGHLCMIGDPKQAIFGFRGGDVHAFLAARKGAKTKRTLDRNFRSSPAMLDAVEALFTSNPSNPFVLKGIDFEPVAWGGKIDGQLSVAGEVAVPLTLWPVPEETKKEECEQEMARRAARAVARLLADGSIDGQALQSNEIAVLVRDNDQAAMVDEALRTLGVGSASLRRKSVYASLEALELVRVLDALMAPESMRLARAALATRLLGRSAADFCRFEDQPEVFHAATRELDELRRTWQVRGVQAMVERLAESHGSQLLGMFGGQRILANLLHLGEALQLAAQRKAGGHALREELAERIRKADDNKEEEQLRVDRDERCVQVLTLHKCKGLEYDVVLMPFSGLAKAKTDKAGTFVGFHRESEPVRHVLVRLKDERTDADKQAIAAASRENLAEEIRLFYTGVTRARHACWIGMGGQVLHHLLPDDANGTQLAAAAAKVIAMAGEQEPEVRAPAMEPVATLAARPFDRRLERDWWVHSFSRLAQGGADAIAGGVGDEAALDLAALAGKTDTLPALAEVPAWPRGPRYGNAVHAILERSDFADWAGDNGARAKPSVLIEQQLTAAGFAGSPGQPAHSVTRDLVAAALTTPIVDQFKLADLAEETRRAELAFHFGIAGAEPGALLDLLHKHGYQLQRRSFSALGESLRGLMTGVIDLVYRHDERWWIVDYKTNYLGPRTQDYGAEHLAAAVAAHDYDLQYLIYSVALNRWLGNRLGSGWDYRRDMGGVQYLFLRGMAVGDAGCGVFADLPPWELVDTMDRLLQAPGNGAML